MSMVDSEMPPPKRTGKPVEEVSLTGKVFPWEDDCPVYFGMHGSPYLWLPCFSEVSKLRGFLQQAGISHERIKVIDDGHVFMDSFPRKNSAGTEIRFMIDPYFTADGKVRYVQVLLD
jgi:hypothetical protein